MFTRFNIDPDDDEDLPDEGPDILDEMTGGEEVEDSGTVEDRAVGDGGPDPQGTY